MSRLRVSRPAIAGVVVAAIAFLVFYEIRGYPWLLASLAGLAVGLQPYAAWRAIDEIRAAVASLAPPPEMDDQDG